jgi:hypothetical protein
VDFTQVKSSGFASAEITLLNGTTIIVFELIMDKWTNNYTKNVSSTTKIKLASYVYTNLAITSGQDDDKFQEYDVKKGHFDGKHFFVQKKKGKHEESEVLFSYPMPGEDKDDKSRPAISGVEFPIE